MTTEHYMTIPVTEFETLHERIEQAERERDEAEKWGEEIVCSVCGWNHDRDESATCEGCEAITLDEFLQKCRDRGDTAEARLAKLEEWIKSHGQDVPTEEELNND